MKTIHDVQCLVDNKNILLVGNNDTINKTDNSKIIDSYDIVVRMNHGVPEPNLGSKTDIWLCSYNNVNRQPLDYQKVTPKIVIRLNADGNINDIIRENLYIWDKKEHLKFKEHIDCLPSTGVMAIEFFLNFTKPKSLTLIGYDNFKTKTFYNLRVIADKYHDINKEAEYTNNLINEGKIIKI